LYVGVYDEDGDEDEDDLVEEFMLGRNLWNRIQSGGVLEHEWMGTHGIATMLIEVTLLCVGPSACDQYEMDSSPTTSMKTTPTTTVDPLKTSTSSSSDESPSNSAPISQSTPTSFVTDQPQSSAATDRADNTSLNSPASDISGVLGPVAGSLSVLGIVTIILIISVVILVWRLKKRNLIKQATTTNGKILTLVYNYILLFNNIISSYISTVHMFQMNILCLHF